MILLKGNSISREEENVFSCYILRLQASLTFDPCSVKPEQREKNIDDANCSLLLNL